MDARRSQRRFSDHEKLEITKSSRQYITNPNSPITIDSPITNPQFTNQLGGWLFRHRTWLPIPFAVALLVVSPPTTLGLARWGPILALAGEALRIWAVRHIGVISRTRADRSGPLVVTGPFAIVRNPLYVGNLLIWTGMACWAGAVWALPVCWLIFVPYYVLISRWEEHLLETRLGAPYRAYQSRVNAWLPRVPVVADVFATPTYSWRETLFSERGTLIAIVVMATVLSVKILIT